ncbi:MFS transporter [Sphingomonas sp. CGMCC 1.13654]|uniref:MFS transporter n=1 Tax=Sphingomonas chungangi TaxID=2683589 RepID=A0A838L509_9SPHN|nr:MFS transporter [Sphingomonas chungangi]MBA2933980.1 MFS transporter [Sphingomonas chungangi]MVW57105.1 MFS transporter [Sphingomonas chungangi]
MNQRAFPLTSQLSLIVAVSFGNAVAHLCTSALPFQIGALIDGYRLSATEAGLVGFFQVGALAVSMMLFAPAAHRFRPTLVCLGGMAIAAIANLLLSSVPPMVPLLCALATTSGIGYGLVLTAAVSAAAGSPRPDQIYAAGNSGALLLIVAMLSLLPWAAGRLGPHGTFIAIPLLILFSAPAVLGFRAHRAADTQSDGPAVGLVRGVPLFAVWALFSFGTGAMWAFAERTGRAIGLPGETIGLVLSTSAFAGLIGSGLAAVIGGRINRTLVLGCGLIGGGITCLTFSAATDLTLYAAAALLYWVFTMFVYVLLLGTAAELDPSGRLGTLGTGCERMAFAISAPLGGVLVDLGSPLWVGVGAAVACAVVAPLFLPALGRMLTRSDIPEPTTSAPAATVAP